MKRSALMFLPLAVLLSGTVATPSLGRGLDSSGGIQLSCQKNFHVNQSVEEFYNKYSYTVGCGAGEEKRPMSFTVVSSYHKPTGNYVEDITSSEGPTGHIESVYPQDPLMFNTSCTSLVSLTGDVFGAYGIPGGICDLSYLFLGGTSIKERLRAGFVAETTGNPTTPPFFTSPKEGSTQSDPRKVDISLFTPWWPAQPCREWHFSVQLERWDPDQGSAGKWVGGPYYEIPAYSTDENVCRGTKYVALSQNKYRATGRARHGDGWSTPWSNKIPFEVKSRFIAVDRPGMKKITLTKPNGGETFRSGDKIHVRWAGIGVPGKVRVLLKKGSAPPQEISTFDPAASGGYYRWTVPENIAPGSDYRIVVESKDSILIKDASDADFTIAMNLKGAASKRFVATQGGTPAPAPTPQKALKGVPKQILRKVSVSYPKGGETWTIGDTREIKWSSSGITGPVMISLIGGGGPKVLTTGGTPNDGSFSWKVEGVTPGDNYRIAVKAKSGPGEGKSASPFKIRIRIPRRMDAIRP